MLKTAKIIFTKKKKYYFRPFLSFHGPVCYEALTERIRGGAHDPLTQCLVSERTLADGECYQPVL